VFKANEELGSTVEKQFVLVILKWMLKQLEFTNYMCGCNMGFRDRDLLEQKGADYIIDTPQELLKIIDC
jgi:phosphoglycolate phosphatase